MAGHDEEGKAMLRKLLAALILIPLVVVLVAFAVVNRQAVTISFDPFSSTNPAYAVTLPLFVAIFSASILGVLVGGFAAWLRQGKWRRTVRRLDADVRLLHQELETIRRRFGTEPPPSSPTMQPDVSPLQVIPPPVA
jgi:uncharacterized integral membrane protein